MFEPGIMVFLFLAIGVLGMVIVEVSKQVLRYRIAREQNALKLRMVERGFTASEINCVLEGTIQEEDEDS